MLTAAELLSKGCTRAVEKITVPLWGEVYVRGLSAAEYDRFEAAGVKGESKEYTPNTSMLLRLGVVDADGKHVFTDSDLTSLANLSAEVVRPLVKTIFRLCGIGTDLGKS